MECSRFRDVQPQANPVFCIVDLVFPRLKIAVFIDGCIWLDDGPSNVPEGECFRTGQRR